MTDKKRTEEKFSDNNPEIDHDLFIKIKTVQSLPDDVVCDLLSGKGKLRFTDFKNRILHDAG